MADRNLFVRRDLTVRRRIGPLFFKVVVAYAKSDFDPTFTMTPAYSDKMLSGRLRVTYFF